MTLVLGIDPAYAGPAGFALIDSDDSTEAMVRYADVLRFQMNKRVVKADERIRILWQWTERLIVTYTPVLIACEGAYQGPNAATTIALAEAIGGLRHLAISHGLPFVRVAEGQQRATAQSYPHALTQRWVGHIDQAQQCHAIDAIAIAQVAAGEAARRRKEAA